MRRAALVLGFTSSAVAVALVALACGIGSHRSPGTVEPGPEEASQPRLTSSADPELHESTEAVPRQLSGGGQNPMDPEAPRRTNYVDAATDRKLVREESTRDVANWYSLLLEQLDLPPQENAALISFLIEDLVARTRTRYAPGTGMDELERSDRIAAIIGDSKRRQFLALEQNLSEYRELNKMQSMLEQNDVPLTDTQRDGLLKILVAVRAQDRTTPNANAERGSIERLEQTLTQIDEYQRLIMELAPGVLSPEQVQYLFDRYQRWSYKRADALERQSKSRAAPTSEDIPLGYPIEN